MLDLDSVDFRKQFWIFADVTYTKRTEGSSADKDNVTLQGDVVWVGRTSTAPTPRIFVKPQDTLTRCHFLHLINEVIDVDDGVIFRVTTKAFTGQEQRSEIAIHIEPNKCTDRALLQEMIRACRHAKEMKELPEKFARVEGICVPHQIDADLKKIIAARKRKEKAGMKNGAHLPEPPASTTTPKNDADVARLGSKRAASMLQFSRSTDVVEKKKLKTQWSSAYRPAPVKDAVWNKMFQAQGRDTFVDDDDDFKPSAPRTEAPRQQRQQTTISRFYGKPANREGFKNLGNSCYMGAVISVLVGLKPFVTDLERFAEVLASSGNAKFLNTPGRLDLFMALLGVCRRANAKGHGVLDLTHVKKAIGARARQFAGREQQDAHEFYAGCMDALAIELRRVAAQAHNDAKPLPAPPAQRHLVSDDNFSLRIKDTLVCMSPACAYKRWRSELCRDLSLSVPEPQQAAGGAPTPLVSLNTLIESFFADNHLECKCDKCGSEAARATHRIRALPRHLVVHLKRFKPDWARQVYTKLQTRLEIPLCLDLAPHCSSSTRTPPATEDAHLMRTAGSPHSNSATPATVLATPRLGLSKAAARPGSIKTVDSAAEKVTRSSQAAGSGSGSVAGQSASTTHGTPPPTDSQRNPIVVDDTDGCGVPRKLDFESNAGASSLSQEESDMQRAIELSAREAKLNSASAAGKQGESSGSSFDHRQFSLGDEEEDLRKALELSQAAGFEKEEEVEVIGDGDGDVAMSSSPDAEEELEMMMPEEASSESDSDSDSADCSEVPNAAYVLHGVVSHLGHTATSGHYVSDVWDAETDQWRRFDDDLVTPLPKDAVLKSRADWQRGGYLLVYTHSSCFKARAASSASA